MAPLMERTDQFPMAIIYDPFVAISISSVLVLVAVLVLLIAVLMCACGGDKAAKKDVSKKGQQEEKPAYMELDKPEKPSTPSPGAPVVEKKGGPPPKGVDAANPAYQTLVHKSKFEATGKSLEPPPVGPTSATTGGGSKVSGTNPAYQTLVHDSKFEASGKGKSAKK